MDQQHASILKKLNDLNVCSSTDADFFYAKCLYIIRNLAKNHLEGHRKISKKDFILRLKNSKKMVFDHWYLEKLDFEKYCRKIRKRYFNDTQSKMNRFFLIEATGLDFSELKNVVKNISDRWSNLKTRNQPDKFCPFIYIHNINNGDLIRLKSDLMSDQYIIEDGYYFKGGTFNVELYLRTVLEHGSPYRTRIKIINDLVDLNVVLLQPLPNKKIYQIYTSEPYFDTDESCDVYVKNIECIKEIFCG